MRTMDFLSYTSGPVDGLRDDVDTCADACFDFDFEGGPGSSSVYVNCYVKSADTARQGLMRFEKGGIE